MCLEVHKSVADFLVLNNLIHKPVIQPKKGYHLDVLNEVFIGMKYSQNEYRIKQNMLLYEGHKGL